jgi:hypothetical protein
MTLHSEMDMARGLAIAKLGAAIELDAIQISTLFDPSIRALPYSGAPGLAGWPSLLLVPRCEKSLVPFAKPELLSFDELVELEQNESPAGASGRGSLLAPDKSRNRKGSV